MCVSADLPAPARGGIVVGEGGTTRREEGFVPVAFILDFPGGTTAQYDAVVAEMGLSHGHVPDGALYHGAGPTASGMRVVDVWEADEPFQRFAAEKIGPITQAHGMAEPTIERLEVAQVRLSDDPDAETHFLQVVRMDGVDEDAFHALDEHVLPDGRAPEGCAFHVNGPTPRGWCVVDYWTSREIRDAFIAERVMPAVQAAGAAPPAIEELDLHATLRPAHVHA